MSNNEQFPNPADFQQSADLQAGVSPAQLRNVLRSYNASVETADALRTRAAPVPPPQDPPVVFTESSVQGSPLPLETIPQQAPGWGGPAPFAGDPATVTGVLNGVAASGTISFLDGPTAL
jgi:hypothetical protein